MPLALRLVCPVLPRLEGCRPFRYLNKYFYTEPPRPCIIGIMQKQLWLISWIGETDHRCAEGSLGSDPGPIASAVRASESFDRIHLLTNYSFERSKAYCEWLERTTGCVEVELFHVDLCSPINYADIYEKVCAELKAARLPRDDVELTFHLSPGTPAMAAIWIILAKTRFPARLIQTSKERGLEDVNFFFDLASDFLPEFLKRSDERIERLASAPLGKAPEFSAILHDSTVMGRQIELARRLAAHDVPVLILGETGTGKELFAEAIHASSRRQEQPFIAINCGAIPKELVNAELFGHRKGAFTGADRDRAGHFLAANGGTLFLDEIGDLPLDAQVRLLRALQKGEITPVGESKPVKVDVRIVAATHRNLMADVADGRFREDLFHRLAVGILHLPPLRERGDDVALLVDHYLDKVNQDATGAPEWQRKNISLEAKKFLIAHDWPGNVRELYHTLLRAALWSNGAVIRLEDVCAAVLEVPHAGDTVMDRPLRKGFDLQALLDEVARHYVVRAMHQVGHRKKQAAEVLGFANYQTLGNWMQRLGLSEEKQTD